MRRRTLQNFSESSKILGWNACVGIREDTEQWSLLNSFLFANEASLQLIHLPCVCVAWPPGPWIVVVVLVGWLWPRAVGLTCVVGWRVCGQVLGCVCMGVSYVRRCPMLCNVQVLTAWQNCKTFSQLGM